MNDKKELIKQQLNAFSGWLRCPLNEFEIKAQIAENGEDLTERDKNEAIWQAFFEAKVLFDTVKEHVEILMNGGDDDERCGIDPYYM